MAEISLTNSKQTKDQFITASSFICAIMIVGLHAFDAGNLPAESVTTFVESILSHGLFTGAVPIFLFTSGYLFYRNITCVKDCFAKQKNRIVSVVIPYFAWSTFYYMVYAVGNKVLGISMNVPVDVSLTGIVSGILFHEYCFPLWFMFQLMIYVAISPLIFTLLSNKKVSVIVLMGLALLGFAQITVSFDILGKEQTIIRINYLAYYFAGCIMARSPNLMDKIKKSILKAPLFIWVITYLGLGVLGGIIYQEYIPIFNQRCIIPLIALSLWALLYKICDVKKDIKIPKNVSTMIVYAIHPIVGMVVGMGLEMLTLPKIVHYFAWFAITTLCSCIASVVMKYIKPVHWVFSGNR